MSRELSPVLTLEVSLPAWIPNVLESPRDDSGVEGRMRLAIQLAAENVLQETGGPFGAAVFSTQTGRLVSVGVNRVVPLSNSTLHAETMAIMFAEQTIGGYTLRDGPEAPYELYTSCAPCAMCLGAILWSGVARVYIGALRDDASRIGFEEGPVFPESYQYLRRCGVEIVEGVLQPEAVGVLDNYARRAGRIYNG